VVGIPVELAGPTWTTLGVVNRPSTRYAMSGDLHIAYQVFGDGPFDLVYAPGFISHVEMNWELPYWVNIFRRLSQFCRVIVFDKRGTGLSDRPGGWPTLEERMDDIRAVMDAAGSERAALIGVSEGGPMCMVFAALYPDRASALVLRGTGPRFAAGPDWPWGWTVEAAAPQLDAAEQNWGTGDVLPFFIQGVSDGERAREETGRFERFAASPGAARQLLEMNLRVDVRSVLPAISAPTLVIHRSGDYVEPVEAGRYTAEHIPGATFVELPGDFHLSARPGDEDEAMDVVEQFLTGTRGDHEVDRVLATVLFTDIVGSTEHASALGDQAWRDLLDHHDRLTRREIERFGGREVKSLGDGFLAAFDGPGRAVRCAEAITDEARRIGIEVRCGLHSGECEVRGDDLAGIAVHIGARIGGLAQPGEVLVSATVKDLVIGSGIGFSDRGEHHLKGVPGTWKLFAVAG
jgi:class 3 adenylate cyclase